MLATTQQKLDLTSEQKEILLAPRKFFDYLKEKYFVKDAHNPDNHFLATIIIDAPCFHTDTIDAIVNGQRQKPEFAILLEKANGENGEDTGEVNLVFGVHQISDNHGWGRLVAVGSSLQQYGNKQVAAYSCYDLISRGNHFGKTYDGSLAKLCYITAFFKLMEEYVTQLA